MLWSALAPGLPFTLPPQDRPIGNRRQSALGVGARVPMKKNDLLNVYEDLLSLKNQRFLIELGVAAFNETVRVFERAKLIRPEAPTQLNSIRELAAMARGFNRRFQTTRHQRDLVFRRLAAWFERDLGERTDYSFLRARCQELPILFSILLEHWNAIKHPREVLSVTQVLNLSSSIQRALELAPPAFRGARAKDIEPLLQQCELAQKRCLRAESPGSGAATRGSSPSRAASFAVAFPTRAAGPVARVSVRPAEPGPPAEFQIDGVDSSFTTGRQRLDGKREVEIGLAWHGENRFQVWTFDASGIPFHSQGPFGIVRTEAPPGALTAARSLLLAVAGPGGKTDSEWLVRKGDRLPAAGQCAFRIAAQLGPEPKGLSITVCETDGRDLSRGLLPLGRVRLSPADLPAGGTDEEIEIRCDYRVADPGHARLEISVSGGPPEACLTRTFAYSQGEAAESAAEELDRESRGWLFGAGVVIDGMEAWQSEREIEDPRCERDRDLIEAEDLFYGLQQQLRDLARQVLGIEPSNTLVPLDEWLGVGGEFEFVGVKEKRILMASPEYVTLLREAVAKAATFEFEGRVWPLLGWLQVLEFRELSRRMHCVPSSLPDGPLDRPAFLGYIEAGYRALRDADLDRLESVVAGMSALLPVSFCRQMIFAVAAERPALGGTAARWLPLDWEVAARTAGRK